MQLVDSFVVSHGRAINLDDHVLRTLDSAGRLWPREEQSWGPAITRLYFEDLARLPEHGLLFPRMTITKTDFGFSARLDPRPIEADQLRSHASLVAWDGEDARILPEVKGPDFPWQSRVRAFAQERGADDALLPAPRTAGEGAVSEAAFGSVVLWADGCLVTSSARRLRSTTEDALAALARQRGMHVAREPLTIARLRSADAVWLLSALHTIREVTHLDGEPLSGRSGGANMRELMWRSSANVRSWAERTRPKHGERGSRVLGKGELA